ncbi:hypothetical protein MBLNU457_1271t1 [Dothideomycetes sp. NU457]
MNNGSNRDFSGMDWNAQQHPEGYVTTFPSYEGLMPPVMNDPGPNWTNPFPQSSTAMPPNSYYTPASNVFTLEDYWSNGPLTAPIPQTQLLPLNSQAGSAYSFDDHSHSDPGAMNSPRVKAESFDTQTSDYFSSHAFAPRPEALGNSTLVGNRTERLQSYDPQTERVDSTMSAAIQIREPSGPSLATPKVKKREVNEVTSSPETEQRQKRSYTTEATAKCRCDLCGKLFQRTYNLKAHQDTHNPARKVPFECSVPDCNKKFVRRTDLERHFQSVHVKTKGFSCPMCNAAFARKDTCRRHIEDGCSHRREMKKASGAAKTGSGQVPPPRDPRPDPTERKA